MSEQTMPLEELLPRLDRLANQSLQLWDLPDNAKARLINVSENATYLVEADGGYRSILRVHREDYHTKPAILCELAWAGALNSASNDDGRVENPNPIAAKDGEIVCQVKSDELDNPRFVVMFDFVEGEQPDESQDLIAPFEELGKIAARSHLHSLSWKRPEPFERLTWNLETILGTNATWGNWRDAPHLTEAQVEIIEQTEALLKKRLTAYGMDKERYGLIHADMRLANLIVGSDGIPQLIDFDDCGFGWFLYDFATGISFMEDHPQVPALKEAWLKGYQTIRPLPAQDIEEVDSFVMLRRLALLAWIGSHIEAPEPQELAPDFARVTAELASIYLENYG